MLISSPRSYSMRPSLILWPPNPASRASTLPNARGSSMLSSVTVHTYCSVLVPISSWNPRSFFFPGNRGDCEGSILTFHPTAALQVLLSGTMVRHGSAFLLSFLPFLLIIHPVLASSWSLRSVLFLVLHLLPSTLQSVPFLCTILYS